jgi:hypothetical protein
VCRSVRVEVGAGNSWGTARGYGGPLHRPARDWIIRRGETTPPGTRREQVVTDVRAEQSR